MIYTITFNPSLDYIITTDHFQLGKTNRTTSELILPGGKGLNVSTVLNNLGLTSLAFGFIAGFTGNAISELCSTQLLNCDFIRLNEGSSRINIKMKDYESTEINGIGPVIDSDAINLLFEKLSKLEDEDILILAGSVPKNLSSSIYGDILNYLKPQNILSVVDAEKALLLHTLPHRPFLIKPNLDELESIFETSIKSTDEIIYYAKELQKSGARNIIVSMGGHGALLLTETGNILQQQAPKGTLVNAVGAGDSMIAGFLAGWIQQQDYQYAFKLAVAAGSASAFSETLATKDHILQLYQQL